MIKERKIEKMANTITSGLVASIGTPDSPDGSDPTWAEQKEWLKERERKARELPAAGPFTFEPLPEA